MTKLKNPVTSKPDVKNAIPNFIKTHIFMFFAFMFGMSVGHYYHDLYIVGESDWPNISYFQFMIDLVVGIKDFGVGLGIIGSGVGLTGIVTLWELFRNRKKQ